MSRPLYIRHLLLGTTALIVLGMAAPLATSPHDVPGSTAASASPATDLVPRTTGLSGHATHAATRARVAVSRRAGVTTRPRHRVRRPVVVRVSPRRVTPSTRTPVRRPATRGAVRRTGPTGWPALDDAIARVPGSSTTRWVVSAKYGSWGTADWYSGVVYISPSVPSRRLFDVAVHEQSHLQTVAAYGGDVDTAVRASNRFFGGSDLQGAEIAADCMARLRGAGWTHYTSCGSASWRAGAARLLNGERL